MPGHFDDDKRLLVDSRFRRAESMPGTQRERFTTIWQTYRALNLRVVHAVVRVLPAIEATLAKLAAGPQRPREMEQTARTLGALMRTLRELNALLSQHPLRSADDYDDMPEDIDAFRLELARRIRAFIESRHDEEFGEHSSPDATPAES
jgi:hypothetical protein